jgi:hypothetical protein
MFSAFAGNRLLVTGDLKIMLTRAKEYLDQGRQEPVLIFEDETGKQIDFNFRGSLQQVLNRALPPSPRKGPGRPRIGVVSGEVTLLPAQWEWLERQPLKASGTLRRLIEAARKNEAPEAQARMRVEAAGRFMWSMAGNLEGFEEASRALYSQNWARLGELTANWPADIQKHIFRLLQRVKEAKPSP